MATEAQIQASIERSQAKKQPKAEFSNADLLADSGLSIAHFQREDTPLLRDMTVAYDCQYDNIITMATAVCHRKDTFCKKFGTRTAIENFQAGEVIRMPRDRSVTAYQQIGLMVGAMMRSPEGMMDAIRKDIFEGRFDR